MNGMNTDDINESFELYYLVTYYDLKNQEE